MGEAIVVNFFLTVRVLLVGGFLIILPRITRKGLLFGVYVGEASADQEAARRLLREWSRGCVIVMALSLLVGYVISLAGRPMVGNLTGTSVLLLGALGLYLHIYPRACALAPPDAAHQADTAVAPLVGGEPKGVGLAKFALALCVLVSLVILVLAIVRLEGPLFSMSAVMMLYFPSLNLVMSPFFALLALLTATAKLSVRGGAGGHSIEAQTAFRAATARLISCMALLICVLLAFLSVRIIDVRPSDFRSLGGDVWIPLGLMASVVLVFIFVSLIRIVKRYGQGGALMEMGTAESPLTDGLADNRHWVAGLFFVDKNDPSIMVEKRFGFGYTFNYGNWKAVLISVTVLGFTLVLIALALFVALS